MTTTLKIQCDVRFRHGGRGARKRLFTGGAPASPLPGRVPRISRLMALAIRFEQLIRSGDITDYAEVARLGHVTRARVTQIMNLLLLAPDIQEQLLFLANTEHGHDLIHVRDVQPVVFFVDWRRQRRAWRELCAGLPSPK